MANIPQSVERTPGFKLAIGLLLLLLWVVFSSFSILTTEDLIRGGSGAGIRPSWITLTQLWELANGLYSGVAVVAILLAWAIFVCYIIMSVAEEINHDGTFKTICWIVILLDGYANWHYLRILPAEYQWIGTLLISAVIIFCWKKGMNLILSAVGEMAN